MKEIPLYSGSGSKEETKEEGQRNYAAMYLSSNSLVRIIV